MREGCARLRSTVGSFASTLPSHPPTHTHTHTHTHTLTQPPPLPPPHTHARARGRLLTSSAMSSSSRSRLEPGAWVEGLWVGGRVGVPYWSYVCGL